MVRMDGKTISGKATSVLPTVKTKKAKEVKSQESDPERDPDGRRHKEGAPSHKLTEEEFEQVLEIIKELPGFKKNNLKLRFENKNSFYIVYIEDQFNKVIRRIEESELCQLLEQSPEQKGKIFSRSA